ncbi:hypothetical protein F4825DRAFT_405797 [Nemania diffusa]|nr:hypothetical protein F4825DRAFT_405797 [Nemania diffusa]
MQLVVAVTRVVPLWIFHASARCITYLSSTTAPDAMRTCDGKPCISAGRGLTRPIRTAHIALDNGVLPLWHTGTSIRRSVSPPSASHFSQALAVMKRVSRLEATVSRWRLARESTAMCLSIDRIDWSMYVSRYVRVFRHTSLDSSIYARAA